MISLDTGWRFRTDPEKSGEQKQWSKTPPTDAKTTTVPALWNTEVAPGYTGVAWYWQEFTIPEKWKGQTLRLQFDAATESAKVWLNGDLLGEHTGGATPFEFNVTKTAQIGKTNTLAVRVEGEAKHGAGLWQGVHLLSHDEAYIVDCFPQANSVGYLSAPITLFNTSQNSGDAILEAHLAEADKPTREVRMTYQHLGVTPGRNLTTLVVSVRGKGLKPWSPAQPNLYRLQLFFEQDVGRKQKDILDSQQLVFGFREFGFKDNALTVNGDAIRPVSVAPRTELPVVVETEEDNQRAREMLRKLKTNGVSILHLEAPPPALLRLADEEGLLIVESARPNLPAQAALKELTDLILRDRSHPCVLAWNAGAATTANAQTLRQLDPTRFLLVGSKLWLPTQTESTAVSPPFGFLPPITS